MRKPAYGTRNKPQENTDGGCRSWSQIVQGGSQTIQDLTAVASCHRVSLGTGALIKNEERIDEPFWDIELVFLCIVGDFGDELCIV